ncbi:MAG: M16 family metallopeptidase [Sphingomonadaceae bacterium]
MAAEPAPVSELIEEIDIPYEEFTLDNGLTVIVHEDRKAPVVAVSVWYNVGSKDEPPGKTGFAHLFEHIMFNGTENVPGEFFEPLRRIGATDVNGTTWFDRTNYFQTVPTPALEMALFLESDRMGHLLGAVTQETLDNQRGVVQNEKRQGDNQPYGLVEYVQLDALPDGHPYAHSTIGSMADLDAATLDDVKNWFREKYGPNNAVLVLAGDIDAETARPLVEKYFGDIPRGPQNVPAEAEVVTLDEPQHVEMQDRVANVRLYRNWVTPGLLEPEETIPLEVGLAVLGGLSSSKLDNILVRQEKTATRVSAFLQDFHRIGFAEVQVDVKPGEDADAVARRLDQIIDWFIEVGPTEDEVQRVVTSALANRIKGLEQVGGFRGKATALAEGELYAGDPAYYKKQLEIFAAVTPEEVRAAMQKWLTKPELSIRVVPGERGEYEEAASVETSITQHPRFYRLPEEGERPLAPVRYIAPRTPPEVGVIADLDFPDIERAQLSNGIEVVYARRDVVPVTQIALEFDAGHAADPRDKLGTQTLMLNLLDEGGAGGMDSIEIAEAKERLGASISTGASLDRTAVVMSALTPNLGPSLDLMAAIVKEPMFDPEELERLRAQQLAGIAQELTNPQAIGFRALPPLIYGPEHPYGIPFTGSGDPELLPSVTREDLVAFHQRWIRPDKAKIFIVSDRPLIELMPLVERHFGEWSPPDVPGGEKRFAAAPPTPRPRIVLVDRPQSPQSLILGGYVTPLAGTDNPLEFNIANEALGGSFLSRINMDLRETKGWSYGARGLFLEAEQLSPYVIFAPVQADRTGDSIAALQGQIERFLTQEGVTEDELARAVAGNVRELPGNFETSGAVLSALRAIELYDRPDDYYEALPARYRAMTRAELDAAARAALDPGNIVWLVVGDAEQVRPQLERLGMPIEEASLQ